MSGRPVDISVLLITYNHEPFIARAVESVLSQVTSRSFELIVSEDASNDRTLEIVKHLTGGDERVRLMVSPTNLHTNETVARAIRAACGRYVSILDGDDHWIVDDKLERQADVLDADSSLSACFHNARIVRGTAPEPGEEKWTPTTQPIRIGMREIWRGNPFATCAGMLRRNALIGLDGWYSQYDAMITDWPLYILCAEKGELRFIDEAVGAYRLHDGGAFSSLPAREKLDVTAKLYRRMDAGLHRRHHDFARAGASRYFADWAEEYVKRSERSLARRCAWYALRGGGVGHSVSWSRWVRLGVRSLL
jgi:glycosyltransferase involved in cell wall biosynthesis